MMRKKARIAAAVVILIFFSIVLLKVIEVSSKKDIENVEVNIYYLDSAANELKSEKRTIPQDNPGSMAESMLDIIKENPKSTKLTKTKPEELLFLSGKITGNTFEVDFSREYHDMNSIREMFFRAAFVWTMTELSFVERVLITIEGEELVDGLGRKLGYLTRSNTVIKPIVSPVKEDEIYLAVLYFTDAESTRLIPENRYINVNPDKPVEYFIVEQLIVGPQLNDNQPTVPPDTKIRDVKIEQGTCYVNLSTDFLLKQIGATGSEKISVYSIVNSLTELPDVDYVQFFIESRKDDIKKGAVSLGNPLERDESLID